MNIHIYKKHLKELKRLIRKNNELIYIEEQKENPDNNILKPLRKEQANAIKTIKILNKKLAELKKEGG